MDQHSIEIQPYGMIAKLPLLWPEYSQRNAEWFLPRRAQWATGAVASLRKPVGCRVFPHDLPAPRSWAKQVYPKLFYWNELDRGGHFAALEEPELFTEELRNCFRKIR